MAKKEYKQIELTNDECKVCCYAFEDYCRSNAIKKKALKYRKIALLLKKFFGTVAEF